MQRTCWIVLLAAGAIAAQRAAAADLLMPVPATDAQANVNSTYMPGPTAVGCAQPTASYPSGIFCTCSHPRCCQCESAYSLAPGCCEARNHCYDNAWDGYCERKAHWDTLRCRFGTGALYSCTASCPTYDASEAWPLELAAAAGGRAPAVAAKSIEDYLGTEADRNPIDLPGGVGHFGVPISDQRSWYDDGSLYHDLFAPIAAGRRV